MRTQIGAVGTLGEIGLNHADLSLRAAISGFNKGHGRAWAHKSLSEGSTEVETQNE